MTNFEESTLVLLMSSSFLITTACLLLLRPVALKIGLTDKPCARKKHNGEIPLIGGLAIYLCMVFFILTESKLISINMGFLTATSLIIATGLMDDFKNLNIKIRFLVEIVAILIMIKWGGVEITSLGNLFGLGEIQLGLFSTPFTVFAILGGINAFNMIDGINGLAGGTSLIIYFILSTLFIATHYTSFLLLCTVLAGATTAFLLFNLPTGRKTALAFLGDAGSMMLGFTISVLIISVSQGDHKIFHPVTALWLIASPLLDTLTIMMQRIKYGRSPFAPDREHLHHLLPIAGYGRYATLGIILGFSLLLALTGLTLDLVLHAPEWLMFSLFIIVFIGYRFILSYTWKMLKVARYLQNSTTDITRRTSNSRRMLYHRPLAMTDKRLHRKRRILSDRRYQATVADIKEFNDSRFKKYYELQLFT